MHFFQLVLLVTVINRVKKNCNLKKNIHIYVCKRTKKKSNVFFLTKLFISIIEKTQIRVFSYADNDGDDIDMNDGDKNKHNRKVYEAVIAVRIIVTVLMRILQRE